MKAVILMHVIRICAAHTLYLPLNDITAANNSLSASSRAAENQRFLKTTQYHFGIFMFDNSGKSANDTVYVV